MNSRLTE